MSRINNSNRDITKAIFSALNESAQAEASMWEADNRNYKDEDEAAYYRNKELYANSSLARHRDAMERAKKACENKGIKLESEEVELPSTSDGTAKQEIEDQLERTRNRKEKVGIEESAPYRRYKVSFYVDTNEMNNMDIEERLNEVLKGSGLASADDTIDVEMIEEFEESSLKEAGEWDNNDPDMQAAIEDLRTQAEEIASEIDGEVKIVKGFDAYQGPFAIIATPKYGDVELWYDQEDDTGRSFNIKVAHTGWISGDTLHLADLLNQDEIPENEILSESSLKENFIDEYKTLQDGDRFYKNDLVAIIDEVKDNDTCNLYMTRKDGIYDNVYINNVLEMLENSGYKKNMNESAKLNEIQDENGYGYCDICFKRMMTPRNGYQGHQYAGYDICDDCVTKYNDEKDEIIKVAKEMEPLKRKNQKLRYIYEESK